MPSSFNKIKRERVSHHYDGDTSSNISDHGDGRLLFGNQHWKRQKLQCLTWLIDRICFGERAALTWYLHAGVNGSGGLDSGWGVTPIYLVRLCILSLTVDHSNAQTQTLSKWLGPARKEIENMAPHMRRQLNGNGALLWWNRGLFLFVGRASEKNLAATSPVEGLRDSSGYHPSAFLVHSCWSMQKSLSLICHMCSMWAWCALAKTSQGGYHWAVSKGWPQGGQFRQFGR